MTRGKRILVGFAGAIVLLIVVAWGSVVVYRHIRYGAEYSEAQQSIRVDTGDRFSVKVHDRGASVGDSWSAATTPDGVLTSRGDVKRDPALIGDLLPKADGCCSGTRLFTFEAARKGSVVITLTNCFQGCDGPTGRRYSRTVAWTVTVE